MIEGKIMIFFYQQDGYIKHYEVSVNYKFLWGWHWKLRAYKAISLATKLYSKLYSTSEDTGKAMEEEVHGLRCRSPISVGDSIFFFGIVFAMFVLNEIKFMFVLNEIKFIG